MVKIMVKAKEIAKFLNTELNVHNIEDNSCNGLQVENESEITKIGFAVDACLESFEKAKEAGCQMLIVHHGMIWDGIKSVKGSTYQQIKYLINNNQALYGVHLPLDKHEKYGNNIQIANLLKLNKTKEFGYHHGVPLGFMGELEKEIPLKEIKEILTNNGMKDLSLDFGKETVKSIAIVSGGGCAELFQAINADVDLYITGEPLHYTYHQAKENKINVIFGGHYETETWGVKALMPLLKEKFNVDVEFIDVPTTV
jgi:dinuclear metal center YbgI/SA1388 family protein